MLIGFRQFSSFSDLLRILCGLFGRLAACGAIVRSSCGGWAASLGGGCCCGGVCAGPPEAPTDALVNEGAKICLELGAKVVCGGSM